MLDLLASSWHYLDLPHSLTVPVWREVRVAAEAAAARRLPPPEPTDRPLDVLVVHGFLDDGQATEPLIGRLRAAGHRVRHADIGRNVACGEVMLGRLLTRLEAAADDAGGPVVLIGHSRGGSLSRAAAVRRPDLVAGLITLGSPLSRPDDITVVLKAVKLGMRGLTRLGVPGLMGECVADGACCADYHRDLTGPFPDGIPFVSIYSPTDGFVAADAPYDEAAQMVAIDVTHGGLTFAPAAVEAIESALTRLDLEAAA